MQEDMDAPALNDLWKYSLTLGEWSCLSPHGQLPKTRYLHSMVALQGSLVVFGGEHILIKQPTKKKKKGDHKLNDVWSFSPRTQRWSQISEDGCMAGEDGVILHTPIGRIMAILLTASVALSVLLIFVAHMRQKGAGGICAHWEGATTTRVAASNRIGIQMSMIPPKTGYERIE